MEKTYILSDAQIRKLLREQRENSKQAYYNLLNEGIDIAIMEAPEPDYSQYIEKEVSHELLSYQQGAKYGYIEGMKSAIATLETCLPTIENRLK